MRKNLFIKGCCVFLLTPTMFTVAKAATHEIDGGTWDRGFKVIDGKRSVYSNYYHKTKKHHSSVKNYQGKWNKSGAKSAATTSKAHLPSGKGTDETYYGFD